MDRERRRKRRCIPLSYACCVLIAVSGCVLLPAPPPASRPPDECKGERHFPHLQELQPYLAEGDIENATQVGRAMIAADPAGKEADVALFDLALLTVHYANPKKDYRSSLSLFNRLVKEHPQSPLVEEAKIWIGILESIEQARRIDIEIEERKKEITK